MNYLFAFLAVALPAITLAADKVEVTVYYESLCPDSQRFFNNQLYPAFNGPLLTHFTLTLVPYGNANSTATGIVCQHGPVECYGNQVQACTIKNETNIEKQVRFINCLMKGAYDNKPKDEASYKDIMKMCGNETSALAAIETCASSPEQYLPLIYAYGNMTKNASPAIDGVPTTFFNGKSSKDINTAATKNFVNELCTFISGNKPYECKSSGKGSATEAVASIALILSALVLSRLH